LSQVKRFERPSLRPVASAGFTLIEALIALAVTAVALSAIGSLMASNMRGSGKIAQHLDLIAAARAVETALPDRTGLTPGELSGEMHGLPYSVSITPFASDYVNSRAPAWIPEIVMITVGSPSGGRFQLKTIRLAKITGEQ
jgi:general secretion pathway protein I